MEEKYNGWYHMLDMIDRDLQSDRQTLRALQDNEFLSDHTAPESMLASLQEMQEQIVRLRQELDGSPQNPEKASACAP